ncbi:MAG: DUF1844 domain-containing protein [Phycisphaerales bacterium]
MADADQPKIIVDDDWKSAARAEKEKLAQAEQEKAEAPQPGQLPDQPSIEHLVSLLTSQALMYMGQIPDQSGRAVLALDVAKMQIDLLGVLEEKTKGNLSEDESKLLVGTLGELRTVFVEVYDAVIKAQAEGKLAPQPGGVDPLGGAAPGAPAGPDLKI